MTTTDVNPETIGTKPVCATCNSEDVKVDAWAYWNPDAGRWDADENL